MKNIFWIVIAVFILYTCTKKESPSRTYSPSPTYSPYSYPVPVSRPNLQFGNYGCTVDCSGHQAGYDWAESNSIDDEDDCTGNSQSFIEGCKEYVEENN